MNVRRGALKRSISNVIEQIKTYPSGIAKIRCAAYIPSTANIELGEFRYLVPARPHMVPAHAGTMDVDIVIGVTTDRGAEVPRSRLGS